MKLRYTSLQTDVGAGEQSLPGGSPVDLGGRPVVVCDLHSQVACVAVAFKHLVPSPRLVFVMVDWGALPVALSDLLADLRRAGLVDAVVSAGEAFGGDFEAVNATSALQVAVAVAEADAVVLGPGPGVLGTGSELGFGGLEAASVVDAAAGLGGSPVVTVRFSDVEPRDRHRGVSHHTRTVLAHARAAATVPIPFGAPAPARGDGPHSMVEVDVPDVAALMADHGLEVTTMGRGPEEDGGFFRYAGAAGVAAARSLTG